ncbi:MAG: UDP-N-acetylglucosamine pyrophosphorylase [Clostridia bacterium]|nr:UDP-N-acetylglucosamine pyrophosphorylase [Clostridia bacterium]
MDITNGALFDLTKTRAAELFDPSALPVTVLPLIGDFILKLGPTLDPERFEQRGENVWIARSAKIAATATINGPCIIDEETDVRPGAFIRGNVLTGKNDVVGNSTEMKNVILFDNVQVPHYNYVGDSILGYRSHMGAGSITSNVKSDKKPVVIKDGERQYPTDRKKVGAFLGDFVEVGCGSVLNPGTVIGRNSNVYPLTSVRGCIPPYSICKKSDLIVPKE